LQETSGGHITTGSKPMGVEKSKKLAPLLNISTKKKERDG